MMFGSRKNIRKIIIKVRGFIKNKFVYKNYRLFKKEIRPNDELEVMPAIGGVNFNIINSFSELEKFVKDNNDLIFMDGFEVFKDCLKKGAVLFLVCFKKEIIHLSMLAMEHRVALFFDPSIKKYRYTDAGYIGPCCTKPIYRGRNIYPYVLSKICNFLAKNGKSKAFINTQSSNKSSMGGIIKAGFSFYAKIFYLKLCFWEFILSSKRRSQRYEL